MDYGIFLKSIDQNRQLKKQVIYNYALKNIVLELNEKYQVCIYNDMQISFFNSKNYYFDYSKPTKEIIEDLENNKNIFEQYKLDVLSNINNVKQHFVDLINESINQIKNKYFCLNNVKFVICTLSDGFYIQYFNNDKLVLQNLILSYSDLNSKKSIDQLLIDKINNIVYENAKNILTNELENSTNKTYYIQFAKRKNDHKIVKTSGFWNETILQLSDELLTDKNEYKNMKKNIMQLCEDEIKLKYIDNFMEKYPFKLVKMDKDFDIETGCLNKSYDYMQDIDNLYNVIFSTMEEYNYLLSKAQLLEMHKMKIMNKIFINKVYDNSINNDHYVVYQCKNRKRRKNIFFKNGKRVGRNKYREVAKLIGYTATVNIPTNPNWDIISRSPLSNEQIELYKDKLNWKYVSRYRKLTDDMLIKYAEYIDWKYVLLNRNIKWKLIVKLAPTIGWSVISKYWKDISDEFIDKHIDDLDISELYHNPAYQSFKDTIETLLS